MRSAAKYLFGVVAVAAWLAFALSPKRSVVAVDAGPPEVDHASLTPAELAGEPLSRDDAMAIPTDAEIVGRHLLIVDRGGARPLHSVDLASGHLVSFGAEGEGPGEFVAPWSLDPVPGRAAAWVWDIALQRSTRVALVDGMPAAPLRTSRVVPLRSSAGVMGLIALNDGGWIGLGMFPDGRWAEFDASGQLTGTYGELPEASTDLPRTVLQQAYSGTLKARPDRRALVLGARYAGRLEIHDMAGRVSILAEVPYPFEPQVGAQAGIEGPVMATGDEVRFGYVDVEAGPERIYALFSGRTPAGFPERPNFGQYVHVFDWEGKFHGALRLEEDAIGLAVDETSGMLYAVSHHPLPTVWRYRLPARVAAVR